MELYALIYQIIECIGIFFVNIFNGCRDIFSLRPGNIGLATCQHFR